MSSRQFHQARIKKCQAGKDEMQEAIQEFRNFVMA